MSRQQELTDHVKELRAQLSDALTELFECHRQTFSEKTGIDVGAVLLDSSGASYLVSRLVASDWGGVNVYGNKIKKNGTPSLKEQFLIAPEKMRIVE